MEKRPRIALCCGCGSQIFDQFILRVSPDLEWHAACLKCADCHQFLDETCTCFVRDGKPYCKRDYLRWDLELIRHTHKSPRDLDLCWENFLPPLATYPASLAHPESSLCRSNGLCFTETMRWMLRDSHLKDRLQMITMMMQSCLSFFLSFFLTLFLRPLFCVWKKFFLYKYTHTSFREKILYKIYILFFLHIF